MFIKLTNSHGAIYVRVDDIVIVLRSSDGSTVQLRHRQNNIYVNELPGEVMALIEFTKVKE